MTQVPFWYDSDPLESDWPAPTPSWRRFLPLFIATVVLVLVVALVAVAGGFKEWGATRFPLIQPATELETGQLRTSFNRASARESFQPGTWDILVEGSCQNISETETHISSNNSFALHVPEYGGYAEDPLLRFGDSLSLNPGLEPVPCSVSFQVVLPGPPPNWVLLGVFDVAWTDSTLTKSGEMRWTLTGDGYKYFVPTTVEPKT